MGRGQKCCSITTMHRTVPAPCPHTHDKNYLSQNVNNAETEKSCSIIRTFSTNKGRDRQRNRERQTDRQTDRGRDREVYATLSSTTAPGASSLKAESGLRLTASKKARTSVLHPQGIKFCQQK